MKAYWKNIICYIFIISISSCVNKTPNNFTTNITPSMKNSGSSPDISTFQGTPSLSQNKTIIPTGSSINPIPHFLYYLGLSEENNNRQIFKINISDSSIIQITHDPAGVINFDISPNDDRIIYINKSFSIILVDKNRPNSVATVLQLHSSDVPPAWSPNGKMIAFDSGGVKLFCPDTNIISTIIQNPSVDRIYRHQTFSPDSTMIVIDMAPGFYLYNIFSGDIKFLQEPSNGPFYSFGSQVYWSSDSKHIYIAENHLIGSPFGVSYPGLWRYSIDGTGLGLLTPIEIPSNSQKYYKVLAPWEDVGKGLLYFLLSSPETDVDQKTLPYYLVRSLLDGVTNRVMVYPDPFYLSFADWLIWDPDGNYIIMVQSSMDAAPQNMILVPIDPSKPIRTLMTDANSVIGNLRLGP
jgi:hypothetical protein